MCVCVFCDAGIPTTKFPNGRMLRATTPEGKVVYVDMPETSIEKIRQAYAKNRLNSEY